MTAITIVLNFQRFGTNWQIQKNGQENNSILWRSIGKQTHMSNVHRHSYAHFMAVGRRIESHCIIAWKTTLSCSIYCFHFGIKFVSQFFIYHFKISQVVHFLHITVCYLFSILFEYWLLMTDIKTILLALAVRFIIPQLYCHVYNTPIGPLVGLLLLRPSNSSTMKWLKNTSINESCVLMNRIMSQALLINVRIVRMKAMEQWTYVFLHYIHLSSPERCA